jgi:hypothetical protein
MWPPNNGNLPPTLTITTQIIHGMRFNIIFYIMPVSVFFRKSQQHHPKKMKFSLFWAKKANLDHHPPKKTFYLFFVLIN